MNPTSPQQIDELLRSKGLNPEDVRSRINQHIQSTFGTPERYAQAIMSKQQGQLSDPQTAEAFRAIAPALFGEGPKPLGYDPNRPGVMSFNFGQTAPVPAGANMHPSARAALDAIGQYQQANPFTIPVAPGTKARWQLQDEEAMRAQAAQEAMAQEKWDWEKDMTERQFAYRQQQDAIANALAQLKAAGAGGAEQITPWGEVDKLINLGADLDTVMKYVQVNQGEYKKFNTSLKEMQDYAREQYAGTWKGVTGISVPPKGASQADVARGFRQLEDATGRMQQAETWGQEKPRFSEEELQRFSDLSGIPIEEIMFMYQQGWLEDFMKKYYGQRYKAEPMDSGEGIESEKYIR